MQTILTMENLSLVNGADKALCRHCGTPFVRNSPREEFCCTGCSYVFRFLHDEGLERYYELRDANPPSCPIPAQSSTETYEFCDDPTFIAKISRDGKFMRFFLEGLSCTACLWLLEKLPDFCSDAEFARVDMSNGTINVARTDGGSFACPVSNFDRRTNLSIHGR